ncbi:MAG: hypothetical protein IPK80_02075 [Nannocystis sp.]|nr:hypothetical protein [Nannocystis sp.]
MKLFFWVFRANADFPHNVHQMGKANRFSGFQRRAFSANFVAVCHSPARMAKSVAITKMSADSGHAFKAGSIISSLKAFQPFRPKSFATFPRATHGLAGNRAKSQLPF